MNHLDCDCQQWHFVEEALWQLVYVLLLQPNMTPSAGIYPALQRKPHSLGANEQSRSDPLLRLQVVVTSRGGLVGLV